MPKIPKKVKTQDFINEENKKIIKVTDENANDVSSQNKKSRTTTRKSTSISSTKKVSTKTIKKSTTSKKNTEKIVNKNDNSIVLASPSSTLEYYDLPYRYNQTIVRILAQTPTTLFVYWDISENDRMAFTEKYGKDFFNTTRPVLLIHNKTKNHYFEVEINDFANSWYLHMQEPNCEYELELGRRNVENPSKYIYVSSSNQLISPNDHVLFEKTDFENIKFKNVKTGTISKKDFGSIRLISNVENIYNKKHKVYHFYNNLYKDEILENNKMFLNPSSGNPTSGMF